jgi:hypothetical protein
VNFGLFFISFGIHYMPLTIILGTNTLVLDMQ